MYLGMLKQLPAMVRQWFNATADKRTADEVESFTAKFVTPVLWTEESSNIDSSKTAFDNMTVSFSQWVVKEAVHITLVVLIYN